LYPHTFAGVLESYFGAIPFFKNSVKGDLLYTTVFFGSFYLLSINVPILKEEKAL
jgi:hypothetical protein